LVPLMGEVAPVCDLAAVCLDIADWLEYWVRDVPGAGAGQVADALRRFAGQLTAPNPDPAVLARNVDELGEMLHRTYGIYEEDWHRRRGVDDR
jgi:hypothetical protein